MERDYEQCLCHIAPPCSFCVEMTEEEAEVYAREGLDGLRAFRNRKEEEKP